MTLETFLDATAGVPDAVLRPAMVTALAVEPARTPEACRRFYDRVVGELRRDEVARGREGDFAPGAHDQLEAGPASGWRLTAPRLWTAPGIPS
jgi:hypothetical protein